MNQQVTEKHLVDLGLEDRLHRLVLDTYNRMENPLDSFERDWKKSLEEGWNLCDLFQVVSEVSASDTMDVLGEQLLTSKSITEFLGNRVTKGT